MRLVTMISVLTLLGLSACGGGKDKKEEESNIRWDCYADTTWGTCECYGLGPFDDLEVSGSSIVEVESCEDYDVCFSYYDEFFEELRCDCGDSTFMPPDDASDIEMQVSCPAE